MGEDIPVNPVDLSQANIIARGTEPFWYFSASGSTLIWQAPGTSAVVTETFTGVILTNSGSSIAINGTGINATLTLNSCSDGMSDISYDYEANVNKGSTVFSGC